jgi:hypothetical protein
MYGLCDSTLVGAFIKLIPLVGLLSAHDSPVAVRCSIAGLLKTCSIAGLLKT